MASARASFDRLVGGRTVNAAIRHGDAYRELKRLNAEKRRARPASETSHSNVVEYLHSGDRSNCDGSLMLHRFTITKRTAKTLLFA
jgi:hypothetical protein